MLSFFHTGSTLRGEKRSAYSSGTYLVRQCATPRCLTFSADRWRGGTSSRSRERATASDASDAVIPTSAGGSAGSAREKTAEVSVLYAQQFRDIYVLLYGWTTVFTGDVVLHFYGVWRSSGKLLYSVAPACVMSHSSTHTQYTWSVVATG